MRTIVIAEPNQEVADALARPLNEAGFRVVTCPGPWPPELRCIRCDIGYCPLTEAADLMIYSPDLMGYGLDGAPHLLAVDSAQAHPDVPLLLAWTGTVEPAAVGAILSEVPTAQRAARRPEALVAQVEMLIGVPA
ncbi:MAG: hypothetical protein IT305_20870 [Chloroflexi bacterium]|nr:hypothetical protein [Chloroflexota bacterium]